MKSAFLLVSLFVCFNSFAQFIPDPSDVPACYPRCYGGNERPLKCFGKKDYGLVIYKVTDDGCLAVTYDTWQELQQQSETQLFHRHFISDCGGKKEGDLIIGELVSRSMMMANGEYRCSSSFHPYDI